MTRLPVVHDLGLITPTLHCLRQVGLAVRYLERFVVDGRVFVRIRTPKNLGTSESTTGDYHLRRVGQIRCVSDS